MRVAAICSLPALRAAHLTSSWRGSVKKLKLNVEELAVASFEIQAAQEPRGTVRGAAATEADCSYTCGDPFSTLYYYYRRLRTTD
jgi:hypothetical protein